MQSSIGHGFLIELYRQFRRAFPPSVALSRPQFLVPKSRPEEGLLARPISDDTCRKSDSQCKEHPILENETDNGKIHYKPIQFEPFTDKATRKS
jgi:hypothetical protein